MLPPRMHCCECRRCGDKRGMQLVAIGFRNVVQTIDSNGKKDVKFPEEP